MRSARAVIVMLSSVATASFWSSACSGTDSDLNALPDDGGSSSGYLDGRGGSPSDAAKGNDAATDSSKGSDAANDGSDGSVGPPSLWGKACQSPADCNDGLTCTTKTCVSNKCVIHSNGTCPWPAEATSAAVNMTSIGAGAFGADLSGAHWDSLHKTLWLCRNTTGDARMWALSEDAAGNFAFSTKGGVKAEYSNNGDLEDLAMADDAEENTVYAMVETQERIHEYDLSKGGSPVLKNNWNTKPNLPLSGGDGSEGLTFVPDSFLMADGFVDKNGAAYKSTQGMGGLFFVAHQNGGALYAFDLNRTNGSFVFVGEYQTSYSESCSLHFDRSTGFLYALHGENFLTLEVLRLSSAIAGGKRKLESVKIYEMPDKPAGGSDNMEGISLAPNSECKNGKRRFFLTIDGGGSSALFRYKDFPCATP